MSLQLAKRCADSEAINKRTIKSRPVSNDVALQEEMRR